MFANGLNRRPCSTRHRQRLIRRLNPCQTNQKVQSPTWKKEKEHNNNTKKKPKPAEAAKYRKNCIYSLFLMYSALDASQLFTLDRTFMLGCLRNNSVVIKIKLFLPVFSQTFRLARTCVVIIFFFSLGGFSSLHWQVSITRVETASPEQFDIAEST